GPVRRVRRSEAGEVVDGDPHGTASGGPQRGEVTGGLGPLEAAEAELAARDVDVDLVVTHHEQEPARVRPTLVQLAGRVQVAWADPHRDRDAEPLAEAAGGGPHRRLVRSARGDEGE